MDAWEGFDPNKMFLRTDIIPNTWHLIQYKKDKWELDLGAIYGLPTSSTEIKKVQLGIYDGIGAKANLISQGNIEQVNLSLIHI